MTAKLLLRKRARKTKVKEWLEAALASPVNSTADRTYQKLVRHLVGLRGVCGHLRGCRAVAIIFPQLNVGLVGPESTFEKIGPPLRHFDGGTRENAVAAYRPLLLITSGLRSRRDSAALALSKIHGARAVVGDCRSWP